MLELTPEGLLTPEGGKDAAWKTKMGARDRRAPIFIIPICLSFSARVVAS